MRKQLFQTEKISHFFYWLSKKIELSSEFEKNIDNISTYRCFEKGEKILDKGQALNHMYFVLTGCARSYHIDNKGNEHTMKFALKDWWICDYKSIRNNDRASMSTEALCHTEVLEFNINDIEELYRKYPQLESSVRKSLELHIISLYDRILNQLELTAKKRYQKFLLEYPEVDQLANNYHIASYLGITQQSLSRLRSKKIL